MNDYDLKKALIQFRENVICAETASDAASRKYGLLRRGMIEHLIERKPVTEASWWQSLPSRLKHNTEPAQFSRYAPDVIAIVRRHVRVKNLLKACGRTERDEATLRNFTIQ